MSLQVKKGYNSELHAQYAWPSSAAKARLDDNDNNDNVDEGKILVEYCIELTNKMIQ